MTYGRHVVAVFLLAIALGTGTAVPPATGDNKRLNESVFVNIDTAQKQNGCPDEPQLDGRLVEAARLHTLDVLNNRTLNGDIGSDGSTPQERANRAGFVGMVSETVAINPALAISGIEILNQWWYNPPYRAIMQDCSNSAIGVWSENSLSRSVVVAVYGQPA
ncbi:CAP domain-containing protein [Mycobacterium sp. 29Ha]|uniref:CAP domain-containing protein n=1 Tax=Mycobacterium sp. 29Ha TaxID=2939268 RepID=UPI002938F4A7|nr:CAP domain-containing protein [Mycobacterium sp. 29Ha]MDV3132909.1 CAP domain-containing protein [Mycobacterium sp. 29Ha]